jgi:hypothetical protein
MLCKPRVIWPHPVIRADAGQIKRVPVWADRSSPTVSLSDLEGELSRDPSAFKSLLPQYRRFGSLDQTAARRRRQHR